MAGIVQVFAVAIITTGQDSDQEAAYHVQRYYNNAACSRAKIEKGCVFYTTINYYILTDRMDERGRRNSGAVE